MKILVLDNFDSFTYNLVHLLEQADGIKVDVRKNNAITPDEVEAYDKILLSPGPGLPSEAGVMPELLRRFHHRKPIFGVCLGFQAIGEFLNCPLRNLNTVCHGCATQIILQAHDPLFNNCPQNFYVGRYHSWVIDETKINDQLVVTASDDDHLIMAARHPHYDLKGVQFHPESVLSEHGATIIKNWVFSRGND